MLAVHVGLLAYASMRHSPVVGETPQLAAGVSHWQLGRYELYRVNPPLVRTLAALPVILSGVETDWSRYALDPHRRAELEVGQDFDAANADRLLEVYTLASWACIPFSVLAAVLCFCWARKLYGTAAGFVALLLWIANPDVLGHGCLISTDVAAAASGLAAAFAFASWLRQPNWRSALIVGICLGVAQLVKTTMLVLYPVFTAVWAIYRLRFGRHDAKLGTELSMGLAIAAISVTAINLGYNGVGTGETLGGFRFQSPAVFRAGADAAGRPVVGNRFAGTLLESWRLPLPRDYVQGIDTQRASTSRNKCDAFFAADGSTGAGGISIASR